MKSFFVSLKMSAKLLFLRVNIYSFIQTQRYMYIYVHVQGPIAAAIHQYLQKHIIKDDS